MSLKIDSLNFSVIIYYITYFELPNLDFLARRYIYHYVFFPQSIFKYNNKNTITKNNNKKKTNRSATPISHAYQQRQTATTNSDSHQPQYQPQQTVQPSATPTGNTGQQIKRIYIINYFIFLFFYNKIQP